MKVQFQLERETKNTYRFFELNDDGSQASLDEYIIGTIYVQKKFFPAVLKEGDTLTIEISPNGKTSKK